VLKPSVIAGGGGNGYVLLADKTAACWGVGGNLGDNTTTSKSSPVSVYGSTRYVFLTGRMGIDVYGDCYSWGSNASGEIGDNTTTAKSTPTLVHGGHKWKYVNGGTISRAGITVAGNLYTWGDATFGALGDGTTTNKSTPTLIASGSSFKYAFMAGYCGFAIDTSGDGYAWGENVNGKLGIGTASSTSTPVAISGSKKWKMINSAYFSGGGHSCGIDENDDAYCWGQNNAGQLGDGTITNSSTPRLVSGSLKWAQISAGVNFTIGVTTSGVAYCWGEGLNGKLGNNTTTDVSTPTLVYGGLSWKTLSTGGGASTTGLATNGLLYSWGTGSSGALGDNSTTSKSTPTLVTFANRILGSLDDYYDGEVSIAVTPGQSYSVYVFANILALGSNQVNMPISNGYLALEYFA
jgi:alpha-tubulin suppressor-like RCC1 family protein